MTAPVFVDTNILVYARDAAHPLKQAAAMGWLERLWREHSGRTSMQVLSELHVTLTRKLRPGLSADRAWDDVEALLAWDPQPVTREVLVRARELERRHQLAWWDCLIVAAAQLQDCAVLLSEDLHAGMRFDGLVVVNPFLAQADEDRGGYEITSGVARRHRRRGRPRSVAG